MLSLKETFRQNPGSMASPESRGELAIHKGDPSAMHSYSVVPDSSAGQRKVRQHVSVLSLPTQSQVLPSAPQAMISSSTLKHSSSVSQECAPPPNKRIRIDPEVKELLEDAYQTTKAQLRDLLREYCFLLHGPIPKDGRATWRTTIPLAGEEAVMQSYGVCASDLSDEKKLFDSISVPTASSAASPKSKTNAEIPEPGVGKTSGSAKSSLEKVRASPSCALKSPIQAVAHSPQKPALSPGSRGSMGSPRRGPPSHLGAPREPFLSSMDSAFANQHQIEKKAKQEVHVLKRVRELRSQGVWQASRLPKVNEPSRTKAHWDYLLEEAAWMATDFAQERKWKKAAARKCAKMVQKYFQEQEILKKKKEKEEEMQSRKIASMIAREIRNFWNCVEKLVDYKTQTKVEAKRKRALDQHLSFVVEQTEKYSSWLAEGMNNPPEASAIVPTETPMECQKEKKDVADDEFRPGEESSDDDEETIAQAEQEGVDGNSEEDEIAALKRESEKPLEDLFDELPPGYLESLGLPLTPDTDQDSCIQPAADESHLEEDSREKSQMQNDCDPKFQVPATSGHQSEESRGESHPLVGEMEVDDGGSDAEDEDKEDGSEGLEEDEDIVEEEEEEEDDGDEGEDEKDGDEEGDGMPEVSLKSLLEDRQSGDDDDEDGPGREISDVAAMAESFQPKGNTLSTTKVVVKVPFLLKHTLREYQHIGLEWLAALHDRRLNGILADEMGLGKTIQTIALLAHLACEKGNWGPHLIVVPTSVLLNWEMEFKKWCPAFKILTYYGSQKERKLKRTGWTKPNAFHVCITSYKLVIQDHAAFRRKKWKYFILDEAQNIKNFRSQRWQLLLNFRTQRRLLLTGTPLQNNLMELWSLMHFLMPHLFQSHKEFKEWFSNPVSGMIEGTQEYNESIIRRLHKVLRPFLLRRLKSEVEKQLPSKYEHVVMCPLSKRQRFLYEDFMSRTKTKETLAAGNFLSVINILMQLRKVCNHPNLFEPRPIISPFVMPGLILPTASLAVRTLEYDPLQCVNFDSLNLNLASAEMRLGAFEAYRIHKYATPRRLIEEISSGKAGSVPVVPRGEARISYKPCRPTVRSNPLESLLPKVKGPEKAQLETLLSGQTVKREPEPPINKGGNDMVSQAQQLAQLLQSGALQIQQTPDGQHILLSPQLGRGTVLQVIQTPT
ncbi:unnamed protein product, partial [Darwinula stevensoni]